MTKISQMDRILSEQDLVLSYQMFLGRNPSTSEVARMLSRGASLNRLRRVFLSSPEFRNGYDKLRVAPREEQEAVLIHMHIPKTAGSSFNRILSDNYEGRFRYAFRNMRELLEMPAPQRAKIDLIFGHTTYGVHDLLRREHLYLFVLRDPKARLYSFYKYIRKAADHPLHRRVNEENLSFGAFLDASTQTDGKGWDVDNAQMKRIAGVLPHEVKTTRDFPEIFRSACRHCFSQQTEFGLVDEFPAYLMRLKGRGILKAAQETRLNITNSSSTLDEALDGLSPNQHAILVQYTDWDQRLYDICADYLGGAFPAS
ncbi:Sulfotransferase family protein [Jannaschia faecimaris]|uniref:Sulfotransferase family protein n=1 Tax=Jannaschia faecimaris TaxID=1244108 RepID=A0A1H3K9X3_9RHOB|nr:sulfotransferase family 2 domain-containing protein [Jannaschia faecimaris]SDY48388.1 Sulfotransferase family protein [Jannaschia faecimaris]